MASRRWGGLAVLLTIAALSFSIGYWFRGWMIVDSCLDRGGRWNAERVSCEYGPGDASIDLDGAG